MLRDLRQRDRPLCNMQRFTVNFTVPPGHRRRYSHTNCYRYVRRGLSCHHFHLVARDWRSLQQRLLLPAYAGEPNAVDEEDVACACASWTLSTSLSSTCS